MNSTFAKTLKPDRKPSSVFPAFPRWIVVRLDGTRFEVAGHTMLEAACMAHFQNQNSKEKGTIVKVEAMEI